MPGFARAFFFVTILLCFSAARGSQITATGYGSTQPVADNTSVEGKAKNRRVEVAIFADEKMQKAAKRGQL